MARLKTDGFTVEFRPLNVDAIDTDAIVNPTDSTFSGTGGLDRVIHKKAGAGLNAACKEFDKLEEGKVKVTDGFQLPVKSIVHVAVPACKAGKESVLVQCYLSCLEAVTFSMKCCSITLPLLGTGSKGWSPRESMKCAWRAILQYSQYAGFAFGTPDKLRKIVISCDASEYPWIEEYQMSMASLFFRVPEQWGTHGDLFFWDCLQNWFSVGTLSALGVLRTVNKIFYTVTGHGIEKGKVYFAKKEGYGKLSGLPINCDFQLKIAIPLILDNFCRRNEELGLPPLETVEAEIGDYEWTIPKECSWYLENLLGDDLKVVGGTEREIPSESVLVQEPVSKTEPVQESGKKVNLKEVGLRYSPIVEKALQICFSAHKNQKDLSGLPYVFHPFHLAEQMETEEEICAALLHDVVEDSDYTIEDLKAEGFSQNVLGAVELLTHDLRVPYMEYIQNIRRNELARKVKIADIRHNSDTERRGIKTEADRKRLRKYRIALAILEDDRYDPFLKHYRKVIPLDENRIYFLSVFYIADGTVEKYSLDVEVASDSHIEFKPGSEPVIMRKTGGQMSFPEALAEFFDKYGKYDFMQLLKQCGIEYQVFHFE